VAHRKLAIFRRRTFTALSVLSLLLCVATLALWVRSYWRLDSTTCVLGGPNLLSIHSLRGHVELVAFSYKDWALPEFSLESQPARHFVLESETNGFLGFYFVRVDTALVIAVPHWFLALLFAILPALHLRATIRSRRRGRAGQCPRCGYDLRATPARCPECGLLTALRLRPPRHARALPRMRIAHRRDAEDAERISLLTITSELFSALSASPR
jgi:hypothetical protein